MTAVRVAVFDYRMSNLASVTKALEYVGAEVVVARGPAEAHGVDAVVLPGVGNFGQATKQLAEQGLDEAARDAVREGTPLLGICLGMQLLFDDSEESPGARGLGLISGSVRRLQTSLKVPNIGWRNVSWGDERRETTAEAFYFVHSFVCKPNDPAQVLATADHGGLFCAAAGGPDLMGVQFHPEKSSNVGLRLLSGWLSGVAARTSRTPA